MKGSTGFVVVMSLLGCVTFGGEAFGSYVVTHRRAPRAEAVTVEREAKSIPPSVRFFESYAEWEPEREEQTQSPVVATWSGNGKKIAFDRSAAIESLRPLVDMLGVCRVQGQTRGEGTATVVFMGTGRVLLVKLDAPYKQTAVGACIERRLSHAETPVFDGDPEAIRVRFSL